MASVFQPNGFRPAFHTSGTANPRQQFGSLQSNATNAIYSWQPCKLVSGYIQAATAADDTLAGIFAGAQWMDSVSGFVKEYPWVPANTTFWPSANEGDPYSTTNAPYVYQDTAMEFVVQANGPLAITALGQTFNLDLATIGNGSAAGYSEAALDAVSGPVSGGQFIVTELYKAPPTTDTNQWGDAYTIVMVKLNPLTSNFS
jgi:hypothetical protein